MAQPQVILYGPGNVDLVPMLPDANTFTGINTFTQNIVGTVTGSSSLNVLKAGDTMTGALTINTNSTTALLVEQDGVKDNVLVVDTTNGWVGINKAPSGFELDINGNMATCFGFLQTISSGGVPFFTTAPGKTTMRFTTQRGIAASLGLSIYYDLVGVGTVTPSAKLHIVGSADTQQLIVKAHSTQTANLQEWQNSSGTVLAGIEGRGTFFSDLGIDVDSLFIGKSAGKTTGFTGTKNIAIGTSSLGYAPTTAALNIFMGYYSGIYVTTGSYNVGIGAYAVNGTYPCTASNNFGLGYSALKVVSSGGDNVAIGTQSQPATTTGQANISIGRNTLLTNTTGQKNTAIGSYSGYYSTGDSNIYIGYNSGYRNTSSNILIIDNQDRTTAGAELTNSIIYGVMAAAPASQTLALNAVVSISDGLVVNEGGLSTADLRAESDAEANMIFLDASADTIEFGGTGATATKVAKGGNITSPLGDIGFPYGSFSDSTTQTFTSTTTAYPITFNTDEVKSLVTHSTSTNPSRIYVDVAGTYLISYSACASSPAGNGHVNFWLRKNNSDIARTNTTCELNELQQIVITVTYLITLAANDYIELVANSQDVASCTINATGVQTTPDVPASPSIILTINKISK